MVLKQNKMPVSVDEWRLVIYAFGAYNHLLKYITPNQAILPEGMFYYPDPGILSPCAWYPNPDGSVEYGYRFLAHI